MIFSWAYLAGFLDGDGWISFSKNKNCATKRYMVGFTQKATEWRYIAKIYRFLKSKGIRATLIRRTVKSPMVPRRVNMINIHVREQESIVKFVEQLIPFLFIKKKRAEDCLLYLRDRLDKRGVHVAPVAQQITNIYWTPEDIQKLRELQVAGHWNKSIAAKLNRSVDSVSHKLYRMGLVRRAA